MKIIIAIFLILAILCSLGLVLYQDDVFALFDSALSIPIGIFNTFNSFFGFLGITHSQFVYEAYDLDNVLFTINDNLSIYVSGKLVFEPFDDYFVVVYSSGTVADYFTVGDSYTFEYENNVLDAWGLFGEWISHYESTYRYYNNDFNVVFKGYRLRTFIRSSAEYQSFIS